MDNSKFTITDMAAIIEPGGALGFGTLAADETREWIARVILFKTMAKLIPKGLDDLRGSAIGEYAELLQVTGKSFPNQPAGHIPVLPMSKSEERPGSILTKTWAQTVCDWPSLETVAPHFAPAERLRSAIYNWTIARHFEVGWFLDAALTNVMGWTLTRDQHGPAAETWVYPGLLMMSNARAWGGGNSAPNTRALEHLLDPPAIPPYNPAMQTRQQHSQLVKAEVDRYQDIQEALFRGAGFETAQRKRSRSDTKNPWVAYKWFVRYQVQGWKVSRILDADTSLLLSDDAVYKAGSAVADVLRVPLRSPTRGAATRDKKKSTKS